MKKRNVMSKNKQASAKIGECTHRFEATNEKGSWSVAVLSTDGRHISRKEKVSTTFFKCTICGIKKNIQIGGIITMLLQQHDF